MPLQYITVQFSLTHALILLLSSHVSSLFLRSPSNTIDNTMDHRALLAFKALISNDPSRALASWDEESPHLCLWQGVTCNEVGRVVALGLDSLDLVGSLTPFFSNLTFLQRLHLPNNGLHGSIPRELASLSNLQHLNLSFNFLAGEIPTSLAHCLHLRSIDLSSNKLRGVIPDEFGSLTRLEQLIVSNNGLTVGIPDSIGNLSSLAILDLSFNNLSGVIPSSLWELSSLTYLYLQSNKLRGALPLELGDYLPRLQHLYMQHNEFSGTIPTSLGSLSDLTRLLLSYNRFDDWAFLDTLANCRNLRVLELSHNMLRGNFPSSIPHLSTSIEWLALSGNDIAGSIPPEIGNLVNLTTLYLSDNLLTGTIPATIGRLQRLQQLSLFNNKLSGFIPLSLGNLERLRVVTLASNNLKGGIPHSIKNISSLSVLNLSHNDLEDIVPPWLSTLSGLTVINLSYNNITGTIPPSLWNLSSLEELVLSDNKLTGSLPPDIGRSLPRLRYLLLSGNQFHGLIPISFSNSSALELFDLGGNDFRGTIPRGLGNLRSLQLLRLNNNKLEAWDWSFLDALANCTKLEKLILLNNQLGGILPNSIGNLSSGLQRLDMGGNQISGSVPAEIENLASLNYIDLGQNNLSGNIPLTIGRLQRLQILYLDRNKFSGEIPSAVGNLTGLIQLYLHLNKLNGSIPISLSNCPLELLNLNYNKLTGLIPKELLSVSSLSRYLGLSDNLLSGPLPSEVGRLRNLRFLDVSSNRLSGAIPSSIGECQILEYLYMHRNQFSGIIPLLMQHLRGLQVLDLSFNYLSGHIPGFLETFPYLIRLNLSFNNLEGSVPESGVFRNFSALWLLGNNQLCGDLPNLGLQPCPLQSFKKKSWSLILLAINAFVFCVMVCVFVACFLNRKSSTSESEPAITITEQSMELPSSWRDHMEASYEVLFSATDGFSISNLIGRGSFGSVYKGTINYEGKTPIAVKVIDLQQRGACKSFTAECKALRNICHRNLVKVFTSCSTFDPIGNEFKAIVFEYMPNGSLETWLHPNVNEQSDRKSLTLIQKLNMAIDVASALDYLHHHGPTPIAHCDLKPGNVLLDYEMNAHVGDFGLSRFLAESVSGSGQNLTGSIGLRGSIGYIAPEYGVANRASTEGDVYSYGVLLLEMFTGLRPSDGTFDNGLSLRKFVEMAIPEGVMDIANPLSPLEGNDGETDDGNGSIGETTRTREFLVSVFRIGIACTNELPSERLRIGDVILKLVELKMLLFAFESKK